MIQVQTLEASEKQSDFWLDSMGPRPYDPITTGFGGVAMPSA